jgi:hypothetical protein
MPSPHRAGASRRALAAALTLAAAPLPAIAAEGPEIDTVIVVGQGDQPITVQPRGLSVSLGETEFRAATCLCRNGRASRYQARADRSVGALGFSKTRQ